VIRVCRNERAAQRETVSITGVGTVFVMFRAGRPSGCGGVREGRAAPGARGPIAGPRRPDGPARRSRTLSQ
jgi:hypothetical protein